MAKIERPKPEDTAFYRSQYAMDIWDKERINEILKAMNDYAIRVRMFDVEAVIPFIAILRELFAQFKPIMPKEVKDQLEKEFKEIEIKGREEVNSLKVNAFYGRQQQLSEKLINQLNELQDKLLQIRQIIGLGIWVEKVEDIETKLKRVLLKRP